MGRKRIEIRPLDILEFVMPDTGERYEAAFNMEALIYFQDMYGGLDGDYQKRVKEKPFDVAAELLHCGMKAISPGAELDTAKVIMTSKQGLAVMDMIFEELAGNFSAIDLDEVKKKATQMMADKKVFQKITG